MILGEHNYEMHHPLHCNLRPPLHLMGLPRQQGH